MIEIWIYKTLTKLKKGKLKKESSQVDSPILFKLKATLKYIQSGG